ncbi:MAG: PQQ-like beta-propeller repeat protein [Planctomycetales bacterium]|nr:PQQ-like beta-propeller repeat protein [Planctomycetales bacterium]
MRVRCTKWFATLIVVQLLSVATICSGDDSAVDFASLRDENWHQWRGPAADGVAPHAHPPVHWDESNNVRWKVNVPGESSATPIVWGDRVFVVAAVETDRELDEPPPDDEYSKTQAPKRFYRFVVTCLDRHSGAERWSHVAREAVPHQGRHYTNTYASASPTTDGQRLYVSFGSQGIYCYNLDGELLWQRDFGKMRTRYGWGEATSPVVHQDRLVVNWDHEDDSALYLLDAETGRTLWRVDRDEPTSWATPLLAEHDGQTQIVVNGTNFARGYDFDDGSELWRCDGQTINAIPSPVAADGITYCMSGKGASALYAIPLSSRGDVSNLFDIADRGEEVSGRNRQNDAGLAWQYPHDTPYVPSPLLHCGRLYFTRSNSAIISCLDASSGAVIFGPERLPNLSSLYASPVAADGHVFLVGRDGTTLVIRAAATLDVVATNTLDARIDASPAIVGDQLFLRGHEAIYCLESSGDRTGR